MKNSHTDYFLKLLLSDLLILCHCPKGWTDCQEGFVFPVLLFLGLLDKERFGGEHYVPHGNLARLMWMQSGLGSSCPSVVLIPSCRDGFWETA